MPNRMTVIVLAACPLLVACGRSTERERVDFERMRIQQRADLYGESHVFPNGTTMQAPPAGTVARGAPEDTGVFASGMIAGRAVTAIPQITPQGLSVGAKQFRVYCAVCHGLAGYGGSTVAENMGPPRPPSLRSARLLAAPVGYIFTVATHGFGRMPSYAEPLTPGERWDVVAYIRQLQRTPPVTRDAIDDSLRAVGIQHMDSVARARGKR